MVIGHGMVAKSFGSYASDNDHLIFASGVSNSKATDPFSFERELDLLSAALHGHASKRFIYFSTYSIWDPEEKDSLYVLHKKKAEDLIINHSTNYLILRVSNLAGRSDNPNTILNFFYRHISQKIHFRAWMNATRNLLDIDDLFSVTDHILRKNLFPNKILNVANPESYTVPEIIQAFEQVLHLTADYDALPKGRAFEVDVAALLPLYRELNITFGKAYLEKLIKKYYSGI